MPSTEKVAPGKPGKNGAPPAEIAGAEHRNIKSENDVSGMDITVLRTFGGFMYLGFLQILRSSAA